MANEIQAPINLSGATLYFQVYSRTGTVWNGSAFETYDGGNWTTYDNPMSELGTSGIYVGSFPSTIPAGVYGVVVYRQVGGAPAQGDLVVASGDYQWNGSATVPLSDLATSGQLGLLQPMRVARGTMIENWLFDLVSSADHVTPFTSGTVSGQILRDNGSFGVLQSGAFSEKGLGVYRLQALTSGDLLCNTACLYLTAAGVSGGTADPRKFFFVTQRTSGQP